MTPPSGWTARQLEDYQVWSSWNAGGQRVKAMAPLMARMKPLIRVKAKPFFNAPNLPNSAIEAEFKIHAVKALADYDPKYGVPVGHHIMRRMDGAKRFVYNYQNLGRIPVHRVRKIGEFKSVFADMEADCRRPPTAHELADRLSWPVGEVTRMTKELRDDLLPWKGSGAESAFDHQPSREQEILGLLPYELGAEQQRVFEYVYGYGGKPRLGTSAIASTLSISPSSVSKIKLQIAEKVRQYVDG